MKKLITLTFAITVLMLGAIGIQAQTINKYSSTNKTSYSFYKNKIKFPIINVIQTMADTHFAAHILITQQSM